jgi:hypothetical protein
VRAGKADERIRAFAARAELIIDLFGSAAAGKFRRGAASG